MSTVALNTHKPLYCHAYLSNDIADLTRIYEHDINLCQVEREVECFAGQLLARPASVSFVENIERADFDFFSLLADAGQLPGYREFCTDVAQLVGLYCDLFDLKRVRLRLLSLDHAMCPKFHFDSVACRLICTYGGTGTQWLEDAYLDRRKLGTGSGGLCDEESGLILDPDAIHTMPPYAVGLLKGSRWEGNEPHRVVHRSPHINSPRLLLTLDFG